MSCRVSLATIHAAAFLRALRDTARQMHSLQAVRRRYRISINAMSELSGYSRTTLRNYEAGRYIPGAFAFGVYWRSLNVLLAAYGV